MSKSCTVTIGFGVYDQHVRSGGAVRPGKQEAEITTRLGGGAANVARQMQRMGRAVAPVLMVGRDLTGQLLAEQVAELFPHGQTLPTLDRTRTSIIVGEATMTNAAEIVYPELADGIRQRIAEAEQVVIAPHHPRHAEFVEQVLNWNPCSVLQLSAAQARHPSTTRLAAKAACVAVNDHELSLWSGEPRMPIVRQMQLIRDRGVSNLIVTHEAGVHAFLGGDYFSEPAFQVREVSRTSAAGDTFLGAYLALADAHDPGTALGWGQAAAALFVEGTSGYDSPPVLQRVAQERPRVARDVQHPHRRPLAARLASWMFA